MRLFRSVCSRAIVVPSAAAMLVLGACGSEHSAQQPSVTAQASATTGVDSASPGGDATDDATAAAPEENSANTACITGSWSTDATTLEQMLLATLVPVTDEPTVQITGDFATTYENGNVTTTYKNQVTTTSFMAAGATYESKSVINGTFTGQFTATDTQLTIMDVDTSGLTMESESTQDGAPLDVSGTVAATLAGLQAGGTFLYTCSEEELTMDEIVAGADASNDTDVLRRR